MEPLRRGSLAAATALAALAAPSARPCAPAPRPGQVVTIETEQALIVWDGAARREHFVRRARFESSAGDFGFLVPTPTPPELAEVPDAVFDRLHEAIAPEVVHRTGLRPLPFALLALPFTMMRTRSAPDGASLPVAAAPQAVRVLEEKRVGGYQAVVLQAEDPTALLRWLAGHGYDARPELQEWLVPYIQRKWTITAFKVDPGSAHDVATQAVRMSFASDRPFFPYREPADQRQKPHGFRELLVYLATPARMEGALGSGQRWDASTSWAAPRPGLGALVAPALPAGAAVAEGTWLHAFVDRQDPRPGTDDLFFGPSPAGTVRPPPVVIDDRTELPLPLDLLAGAFVGVLWWRRRSIRARGAQS